jgi:arylsulfatase A-like enzyme
MVSWPGRLNPRRDDENPVSNLDFVPTALALVGLDPPAGLSGINLADTRAVGGRSAVFGSSFQHDQADEDRPEASLESRWLVTRDWKLIAWSDRPAELYALREDPGERTDRAPAAPQRVRGLRKQLDAWWRPDLPASAP